MRHVFLMLMAACCMLLPDLLLAQSFHSYGGPIPNNSSGNCFDINVTGIGNLNSSNGLVRVCLSIDQSRPNDMDISLQSPGGVTISLSTDNGGSSGNDYYEGLCFSDCGPSGPITSGSNFRGVYSPENSLSGFNTGANGNGTWTLCIDDDNASGGAGILNYWSIEFGGTAMPSSPTGDDCADAYVLSLPYSHTCMSLAGSNNDYNSCTGMMGGADYLYSYTPSGSEEYLSIDIAQDFSAPSGFPTVVLLDTCPDLAFPANCIQTEIQFNSSENILHITSQPLTQGKTYYIVAASTSGTGGTYDIRIASGQNGNDDCLNATVINNDDEYAGNNYAAAIPNLQAPSTAEMSCNGSIDNFVFYTFTTDPAGSTVYVNVTDIDCNLSCGGSCGIQLALFEEPAGGACQGPGTWGPPVHCESSTQTNAYYAWSGLQPSTRYYLMVDGNAGSQCVWNLRAMGDFDQTLLPVDFLSLDVENRYGANQVNWKTANEVNTSHFEVEYATTLPHFAPIGTSQASANGHQEQSYQFTHPVTQPGMHYYRIKSVDQNGAVRESEIASVWVAAGQTDLLVYPNPVEDRLHVSLDTEGGRLIGLYDVTGQLVRGFQSTGNEINGSRVIEIGNLEAGMYFLKAVLPGGRQVTKRFSKI